MGSFAGGKNSISMAPKPFAASELVLNNDGSVYHLALHPDEIGEIIITGGDPNRVAAISRHFDRIDVQRQKREFVTHTGELNGKRITALSTGIGTDNIDIVFNELDALANIDLKSRMPKSTIKPLTIVRLGTSGGLQPELDVDSIIVSSHGLGLDNLMHFYQWKPAPEEGALQLAFREHMQWHNAPITPYVIGASGHLLEKFKDFPQGITVTCSGFYGPQGRQLRGSAAYPDLLDKLPSFSANGHRITNFEMETSGIYGMGRLLGHRCLSVNTIIANRANQTFSKDPHSAVERMIEIALKTLVD